MLIISERGFHLSKEMGVTLRDIGWRAEFEQAYDALCKAPGRENWIPARLISETKINYQALIDGGDILDVVLSGKLWNTATCDADLPAVGDWVVVDKGNGFDEPVIREMLPRLTCFSRKEPGKSSAEQVLGANVDVVAVVTDAGVDYNARRMERYFTLIQRSKARAVVLLNKIDESSPADVRAATKEIQGLYADATVIPMSAITGKGLKALRGVLAVGETILLIGSSGVGKSTIVNALVGDEWMWTGGVNEVTGKGRHTTVARELVVLPKGGVLIDNPGIREVQMWTDEAGLRASFADVAALAQQCKFADCKHGADAGCAIIAAVEQGELPQERYFSFLSLEDEITGLKKRQKKRTINLERVHKRTRKVQARNYADRVDIESQRKPNDRHHE